MWGIKKYMEIDRIDRKILSVLQKNNRIANVELAEEVGLSPPACLKRVKRLRAGKVIVGDVSIINPSLAGNKMTLIVSVEMERDRGDIYSVFRQSIEKAPEVTQCYQITGGYDFMLIVSVADIQAYERFIERVLHQDRNIRKFHTSVSTKTVKFSTQVNVEEIQ
ncbi:Lrp/AsnC family transcriptional regulator [Vibrio tubiashii]|uniref:Transcription regulator protein n=2 Tax=Vibrio tubiashii ATCC 19109 TaxID=1051646 RepID=A0ABN0DAZ4_9VIBR|nr:putative transcription regulator protein [Vibrio tubiashii ATCC 19109]EIF05967.1 transcription regulator protein [Vibrio tubiashii NCIMB 1337 = ATCC 19106]